MVLMAQHRGPLTADLHRYHGVRLTQLSESGFTLTEIAAFAANLPHDSAVSRARDPEGWALSTDSYTLREIEHGLRVLAWQNTADGKRRHPQNYPARMPLTKAEEKAQKPKPEYDPMTIAEANEFLGWSA